MTKYQEPKKHPRTDHGDRQFDTTSLRNNQYGKWVYRDYAAHWFRWQHAVKFVKTGMRVLDVGCGPDQMMARVLCHSIGNVPSLYVGVDMNKLDKKTEIAWTHILDQFDFTRRYKELIDDRAYMRLVATEPHGPFDVITCFEVIEHMPKAQGAKLLKGIRECLTPDGTALLSTPVYNEKHMAANHIHEYRFDELRSAVEGSGLVVDRVVGTFMTSQAAKRAATKEHRALLELLHETWFSWEVLACFLAPLYPEQSSNCCWILRRA